MATNLGPSDVQSVTVIGWFRADEGVTHSSNAVSSWADKSAEGADVTQGTAAQKPTYTASALNGLPGLSFDGGDKLDAATSVWSFSSQTDWGVIMIGSMNSGTVSYGRAASVTNNRALNDFGAGATGMGGIMMKRFSTNVTAYREAELGDSDTADYTYGNQAIFMTWGDGSTARGACNGHTGSSTASHSLAFQPTTFTIGNTSKTGVTSLGWNGYIQEIIFFIGDLTTYDRELLEAWLSYEWAGSGSLLPSGHTWKNNRPASDSVSGSVGSAGASGNTATITSTAPFNANVGSAVVSGSTATFSQTTTITSSVGSSVGSGLSVTLTGTDTLTASVGHANASGNTGTLSESLAASVGHSGASGSTFTMTLVDTISSSVGSSDAGAYSASIASGNSIDCAVGSAVFVGNQASITHLITISGNVGSANANGNSANVTETISCTVASATSSGYSASFSGTDTITANTGSATGVGETASLNGVDTIAAGTGSGTGSGQSSTLSSTSTVTTSVGTGAAGTLSATLSSTATITVSVGSSNASGNQAGISEGQNVACFTGSATAGGQQATISGVASLKISRGYLGFGINIEEAA